MSAPPDLQPAPDAAALACHQWRVSHVNAQGQLNVRHVSAPSAWLAINWMEQLYGLPRTCGAIRLNPGPASTPEAAPAHG